MRTMILAAIAMAVSVGAVAPANAWTYTRCVVASAMDTPLVSNKTMAKECHAFMVGEGVISKGKEKNKLWKEKYPDIHFIAPEAVVVKKISNKYHWIIDDREPLRTKEISNKDIDGYMDRIGYELVENAEGNSFRARKVTDEEVIDDCSSSSHFHGSGDTCECLGL